MTKPPSHSVDRVLAGRSLTDRNPGAASHPIRPGNQSVRPATQLGFMDPGALAVEAFSATTGP